MSNNVEQPSNTLIRQLAKFRKSSNELNKFPDYPEERCSEVPQSITGEVNLKEKRRRRWKRACRYYAELSRGTLKLYKSKNLKPNNSTIEFKIEIDKVPISVDLPNKRFHLQFKKEVQLLSPVDGSTFEMWHGAMMRHRLWKQEQASRSATDSDPNGSLQSAPNLSTGSNTPTTSADTTMPNVSTVLSNNNHMVEGLDAVTRVMDEIKEMYNMTIEVSEKTVRTCEKLQRAIDDMKIVQRDMRSMLTSMGFRPTASSNFSGVLSKEALDRLNATTPNVADANTSGTNLVTAQGKDDNEKSNEEDEDEKSDNEAVSKGAQQQSGIASLMCTKAPDQVEDQKNDIIKRSMKVLQKRTSTVSVNDEQTKAEAPQAQTAPATPVAAAPTAPANFGPQRQRRVQLPAKQLPGECIGFRDFAKMAITRNGLPISNFEPLSMIQLMCEELRYNNLLTGAAQHRDGLERIIMICAFAVSGYSNTLGRNRKPFNPMMGETYDYVEPEWRFHGEQVSHHPPISAGHAEGRGWVWWQSMSNVSNVAKLSATIEVTSENPVRIRLMTKDGQEDYSIDKVKTIIEKATDYPEKRKVNHLGKMRLRCTNGFTAELNFKDKREVNGTIYKDRQMRCNIHGTWDNGIFKITPNCEPVMVFQPMPLPEDAKNYYGYSRFTVGLNEILPGDRLPSTDSRYRPDQRALENGQGSRALQIKNHLENAQRERMKRNHYTPLWFEFRKDVMSNGGLYFPNQKYFAAKEKGFDGYNLSQIFPPLP